MKAEILIVEDHPIVRDGLRQLINEEDDIHVRYEASNVEQALNAVANCSFDAAVVDLSLEDGNGLRLIEVLKARLSSIPVLVFSMHDEFLYAERCLKAGAKGYIMKTEPSEQVISALRKVLKGGIYVSEKVSCKLMNKVVSGQHKSFASTIDILSNREIEVFQLLGKGLKPSQICDCMNISVKTVESYIDHIKKKMDLKSSREVFKLAVQWDSGENKL
jgi:DNA-binding NarL/FixJ family response regulator